MSSIRRAYYDSEIGQLVLSASEHTLLSCMWVEEGEKTVEEAGQPFLEECLAQLRAYFRGQLRDFSLPLALQGSLFAKRVWQQLLNIPLGSTISYRDIAVALGQPQAARAVGQAVRRNPLAIIIPCHRVIGKRGALVGYDGGLWRKEWLLAHEAKKTW